MEQYNFKAILTPPPTPTRDLHLLNFQVRNYFGYLPSRAAYPIYADSVHTIQRGLGFS